MRLFNFNKKKEPEIVPKSEVPKATPKARVLTIGANVFGPINPTYRKGFDGEKTTGQLGAVIDVIPIHDKLALRSYELYAKNDLIKMLTDRRLQWSVGIGLKLEVEPNKEILEMFNISIPDNFYKRVEALWKVYMDSEMIDYSENTNLHLIAWECKKAASLSGDSLVICRIEENFTVQLISTQFLIDPCLDIVGSPYTLPEGNYIQNGIEFDSKGKHVAYYILKRDEKESYSILDNYDRIPAYGEKTGKRLAWIVYADKISHDHKRGVPDTMQVIEKAVKLDRFNEAEVGGAEQRANIVYAIEHTADSTGEDILSKYANAAIPGMSPSDAGDEDTTPYVLADASAQRIAEATESTAINMPIGSKLNFLSSDRENQFPAFDEANSKKISASMNIPYEVALHSYNSNYSASRAAINGFGHMNEIDQTKFSNQFYRRIYKLWFDWMIKTNMIDAPGYLQAEQRKNKFVLEAYTGCKFVGKKMPHIDPLKEANAIRKFLGDKTKGEMPLISHEQATEMANAGDWTENIEEYDEELQNSAAKNVIKTFENGTTESTDNQQ